MIKIIRERLLIGGVFFLLAMFLCALIIFPSSRGNIRAIPLDNHPVLGAKTAPVHMVVFEDFQCPGCRVFNEQILPHLKSQYIDTQKLKVTLIPLPLFEKSDLMESALLIVYSNFPDSFTEFFEKTVEGLRYKIISYQMLCSIAEEIEGIDTDLFCKDLEQKKFSDVLEKNLVDAKSVMQDIETPTLCIDGTFIKNISLSELFYQIEQRLELHAKYQ